MKTAKDILSDFQMVSVDTGHTEYVSLSREAVRDMAARLASAENAIADFSKVALNWANENY